MNILFPQNIYCISCSSPISYKNKLSLCKNCYENINFLNDKNIDYDKEVKKLLEQKNIENIYISTVYDDVMKNMIYKIKYSNATYLAKYFADIMIDTIIKKDINYDYISFVPIHKKRTAQRGYNQVELIANHISKNTNKKIVKLAKRIKNTKSLFELNIEQRKEQMKDAFECEYNKDLKNKKVLILDDILTTGSTISSLCSVITKNNEKAKLNLLFLSRSSIK